MKRITLILITFSFLNIGFSQERDSVIFKSLSYFDKQLHYNFETMGEYILVIYDDDYFIVDKYHNSKSSSFRTRIIYKLQKTDNSNYKFFLKSASTLNGSFNYKNGQIIDLTYVRCSE